MPILEVEVVELPERGERSGWAGRMAEVAGEVLGAPEGATWVRLRGLAAGDYAESGGGPPAGVRPVFVRLLLARLPGEEERGGLARALARELGAVCGRPAENVHVLFEPEARGRIAFGGRLR